MNHHCWTSSLSVINSAPQELIATDFRHNLSIRNNLVSENVEHDEDDEDADSMMGVLASNDYSIDDNYDDDRGGEHVTDTAAATDESDPSSDPSDVVKHEDDDGATSDTFCNNNCIDPGEMIKSKKVQLNFSVDRLLGIRDSRDSNERSDSAILSLEKRGRYDCCGINMSNYDLTAKGMEFNLHGTLAVMDIKSIIRPTPIRASNHRVLTSNPTILFPAALPHLLRYHHSLAQGPPCSSSLVSQNSNIQYKIHTQSSPSLITGQSYRPNVNQATRSETNSAIQTTQANPTNGKRKRSWSRAVFSNLQRKGLEIQFQVQKYITKPDRRKLAARLNLTDAQVKVWFQNRRMKWRHTRENLKSGQEKPIEGENSRQDDGQHDTSSDDEDIDVVSE